MIIHVAMYCVRKGHLYARIIRKQYSEPGHFLCSLTIASLSFPFNPLISAEEVPLFLSSTSRTFKTCILEVYENDNEYESGLVSWLRVVCKGLFANLLTPFRIIFFQKLWAVAFEKSVSCPLCRVCKHHLIVLIRSYIQHYLCNDGLETLKITIQLSLIDLF